LKSKALFVALIVGLLAVACTQAAPPVDALTLTVPSWYDPDTLPALRDALAQWNTASPAAPVEVRKQVGKREAILQKLLLGAQRGDAGDVVLVRNEWLGRLRSENLIVPLPAAAAATVRAQALPALLPAVADAQNVWAWPFDADALVVWQRQDLAPEAPWDQAGLVAAAAFAAQMTEAHRLRAAFAFPAARATNSALAFLPWYFSFGGELSVKGDRLSFAPEPAAQALQWLQQLPGRADNPAALEQNDVFSGMAGGAFALTVGGSWERPMFARQSQLADKIRARVIPGPRGEGVTLVGGWSLALLPRHHAQAPALLAALGAPQVQAAKLHSANLLPATAATLDDPWFVQNADGPTFKSALQHGRALPLHAHTLAALEPIAVMVAETFLGQKDPVQAADDAAQAVAEAAETEPTAAPTPPTGVEVVCPNGAKTDWPQAKLQTLPPEKVGDRSLIALTAFCPGATDAQAEVRAADGYVKAIPAAQMARAYLDPAALAVVLVKDDGKAFTVRDTVSVQFAAAAPESALLLSMGEKRHSIAAAELQKMAKDGKVPFAAILALPGWELNPDAPVVLIARDGYKKDIALLDLQKGFLLLDGMQCEFAGLSSKYQIRDLSEIHLP